MWHILNQSVMVSCPLPVKVAVVLKEISDTKKKINSKIFVSLRLLLHLLLLLLLLLLLKSS